MFAATFMLQFGHGVGAVENIASDDSTFVEMEASIRPRRWSRGERQWPTANQCS